MNPTTIRLTPDDRQVLDRLRELTGLGDNASIIRLAIRALLAREQPKQAKKGGK
jgi:hypothetical protein